MVLKMIVQLYLPVPYCYSFNRLQYLGKSVIYCVCVGEEKEEGGAVAGDGQKLYSGHKRISRR